MTIRIKSLVKEYEENWERIYKKKKDEEPIKEMSWKQSVNG